MERGKTKIHSIDSKEVLRWAKEIQVLLPNDFFAEFCVLANTPNHVRKTADFLESINVNKHKEYIDVIVEFMLKSLKESHLLAINNLIERAYKSKDMEKYAKYNARLQKEAERVKEGVYRLTMPRDVFVAYSSKDMAKVSKLVEELEQQNFSCFVSARNMQHGSGAVDNYHRALQTAIDNCKIFVFVSSKNSRSSKCEAINEIEYVRSTRRDMPRIEYLVEDYSVESTGNAATTIIKDFFEGIEYCYTAKEVARRVLELKLRLTKEKPKEASVSPKPTTQEKQTANKICVNCGTENQASVRCCVECGEMHFVNNYKEYAQEREKIYKKETAQKIQAIKNKKEEFRLAKERIENLKYEKARLALERKEQKQNLAYKKQKERNKKKYHDGEEDSDVEYRGWFAIFMIWLLKGIAMASPFLILPYSIIMCIFGGFTNNTQVAISVLGFIWLVVNFILVVAIFPKYMTKFQAPFYIRVDEKNRYNILLWIECASIAIQLILLGIWLINIQFATSIVLLVCSGIYILLFIFLQCLKSACAGDVAKWFLIIFISLLPTYSVLMCIFGGINTSSKLIFSLVGLGWLLISALLCPILLRTTKYIGESYGAVYAWTGTISALIQVFMFGFWLIKTSEPISNLLGGTIICFWVGGLGASIWVFINWLKERY